MDQVSDLQNELVESIYPVIHIEVCKKTCSTAHPKIIQEHVLRLFSQQKCTGDYTVTEFDDPFLQEHVEHASVCDSDSISQSLQSDCFELHPSSLRVHVYQLHCDGPATEELDDEDLAAANHWLLPASDFQGIWDTLVFETNIKDQLLHYASTTLLFSDKKVDCNIISWNRVILLHGPPGTGKTSLCKALAQKLCIQLSDRYSYGQFIEINSHSLFSKWFSESGKLVMRMFQKIQDIIDDKDALVCVLIDEVESLTAARKASLNGNEPSDSIRVVNALLTQLDQIKKNSNVIILTTSNITGALDLAFVDRADIKQYIGPPGAAGIYKIYCSCVTELMRTGIISPYEHLLSLRSLALMNFQENNATQLSLRIRDIAEKSVGLSGRTLRKLPFIAHAVFMQAPKVTLGKFLNALSCSVEKQFEEQQDLCRT